MIKFLRIILGAAGAFLYMLGRGVRRAGMENLDSLEIYVGLTAQVLSAIVLYAVFIHWRRTRLSGPQSISPLGAPRAIGWLYLASAGFMTIALVGLLGLGGSSDIVGSRLAREVLSVPGLGFTIATAMLVAGAGATAIAGHRSTWALLRLAAVPLATVWPHGLIIGSWAAWNSIASAPPDGRPSGQTA
jgi:hypothetical protein